MPSKEDIPIHNPHQYSIVNFNKISSASRTGENVCLQFDFVILLNETVHPCK